MQSPKKEIRSKPEKRDVVLSAEKMEEPKHIKCVACNKTLIIGNILLGRSLIACGTCGCKNQVDNQTAKGRRLN